MKERIDILEELVRIKDLYSHKRGVVISEQLILEADEQVKPQLDLSGIKKAFEENQPTAEERYLSDTSFKQIKLEPVNLHGLRKCNMDGYMEQGNMECGEIWDANYGMWVKEDLWKKKYNMDVPSEITGTATHSNKSGIKPNLDRTKQTTTANVAQAQAGQIPTELKNREGVKDFQKWLDDNRAGWATGYPGGKVGRGKGYGTFGKRTAAAWNKEGGEYLKSTGKAPTGTTQTATQAGTNPPPPVGTTQTATQAGTNPPPPVGTTQTVQAPTSTQTTTGSGISGIGQEEFQASEELKGDF